MDSPLPNPNDRLSAQKNLFVGGGWWWANPLQTLCQGLVLMLRFPFDPELDNFRTRLQTASIS